MDGLKYLLTRVGAHVSKASIHQFNATLNYLETGRWMREHGFDVGERVPTREDLFARMAAPIRDRRVLYLEFGVWKGASMQLWSGLLRHPGTQLHGFDSFEGLPEDWVLGNGRGHFSTVGELPRIDDPRVRFHKGWFDQTLPRFEIPPHDVLVLNIDCDLYSSTKVVLDRFVDHLAPGTLVYFDEFCDRHHELRAFDELLRDRGMRFRLLGATRTLARCAFVREA